jgi:hypothetical protein
MTQFVTYSIVTTEELDKRAKILSFWLSALAKAIECHNFNLVFQIDAALVNTTVQCLKLTWKKVDDSNHSLLKNYRNDYTPITAPKTNTFQFYLAHPFIFNEDSNKIHRIRPASLPDQSW